jgi:RNA polymerase sigma-70 factor (ECF subfamily)
VTAGALRSDADDSRQMSALAGGDEEAFGVLFDRLEAGVRAVGRAIVGEAGADDVMQETFERVWLHAHQFDASRGSLEAWVFTIARNAALGHLRRHRRHHILSMDVPDPSPSPLQEVQRTEVRALVRAAVGSLPESRRRSVEQVLAGRTMIEAARRLGVPEGTLKSRVRSAYAELRPTLAALMGP